MKKTFNITNYPDDLNRYQDARELSVITQNFGLDGLEVMPSVPDPVYPFLEGQVIGVHMRCSSDWLDLWRGDTAALTREYGTKKLWQRFCGDSRESLLARAREDLGYAREHHAEYVVFHVSNVRATDILTHKFDYCDTDVLEAAADFINTLLGDTSDSFLFLAENLWWPGMRLTDPALTEQFLDRIRYPKKGIMLDVGHFLHTNPALRTQEEGVAYLQQMLADHRKLQKYIRGIHLHQTISGAYVREFLRTPPPVPADYMERFTMAMEHVLAIDSHEPFTAPGIQDVIRQIAPDYLTLEFISRDRAEHLEKLRVQTEALRDAHKI